MMNFRLPLLAATLALASWTGAAQAQVQARVGYAVPGAQVTVQLGAPPAPRREAVPPPRRGHVWAPGHWRPQGRRHVWVPGHWVKVRPGHVYRQPVWTQRNGRWGWTPSRWDRDGDGVPNRRDRRPDNPYRH